MSRKNEPSHAFNPLPSARQSSPEKWLSLVGIVVVTAAAFLEIIVTK